MTEGLQFVGVFGMAAALSAAATPLFARFAAVSGLVVSPRQDRWHSRATPLLGGAAMAAAVLAVLAATAPLGQREVTLLVCGMAAFALGLLDDFHAMAPATKLVGQVVIASVAYAGGVNVDLSFPPASYVVSIAWIVTLMNAVNLIDNMDGLASGVAVIASLAFGVFAITNHTATALLSGATAGAALGFLVHNFYPARIFMGDAGSLFLGFLLAAVALVDGSHSVANAPAMAVAFAVLALPIFDVALVIAARMSHGHPLGRGGRDHSSHRLAALGLSDRESVLVLYAVAGAAAVFGVAASLAGGFVIPALVILAVVFALFGAFLFDVDVYPSAAPSSPRTALWSRSRFGLQIGLDVVLLTTAYYFSFVLHFDAVGGEWVGGFAATVAVIVGLQVALLAVRGCYRMVWRYFGVPDAADIALAMFGAGLVLLIVRTVWGAVSFPTYSMIAADGVLAVGLLIGSRAFGVWLRWLFAGHERKGEARVLVIGAGNVAASLVRMFAGSERPRWRVVGLLDESGSTAGRKIAGIDVVGGLDSLPDALRRYTPDLVVVAADLSDHASTRVCDSCAKANVRCERAELSRWLEY